MSAADFQTKFPMLVTTMGGSDFLEKIANMEPYFDGDSAELTRARPKYSRGFWNTCGAWCFEDNQNRRAAASFRLSVIEAGLVQAQRAGKAGKFRDTLLRDEAGFEKVLAELRLLGALGPLAPVVDIELPGRSLGRNYDVHLAWANGTELHLDSKRRDPDHELGSLLDQRRLDVEQLLGRHFEAFAWLYLRKNFHGGDIALEVAILADECRRIAFEGQAELVDVAKGTVPEWLERSSIVGLLYQCFLLEKPVKACQVNGRPAIFVPDEQAFYLADQYLQHVRLLSGDKDHSGCFIIPAAESQPMLTKESRDAWNNQSEYDRRNPESLAFKDLMSKAIGQLPSIPFNVIAVAIESCFELEDVELAVLGEPVPDAGPIGWRRDHGIVHDDAYKEISGVLVFTVTPPSATSDVPSPQAAHYFRNPQCSDEVPAETVERVIAALSAQVT